MADADLEWNGDRIVAALSEPFHAANEVLGREFTKQISSNIWDWPSEPSPRDIVDTGELRRSYVGERDSQFEHSHAWNVEYGMAVHEGYVLKNGTRMPGRPWTKEPLESGKLERAFEKLARDELGKIR